ncbi:MAG TPA: hypothetical protein VFQ39_18405 [Longimicrobium sp.]|nr:hypothetical protein [Longimicrobium sp.]
MYRSCIHCAAGLGRNEALEAFPVGRQVAFDPEKGRLWAVCARCRRWNLAPIEERWEAVEEAERAFADARLKVTAENIALARLADGTRLVRVGRAPARELAAWRWGGLLQARWRRSRLRSGAVAGSATFAVAGALLFLGPFTPPLNAGLVAAWWAGVRAARNGVERVVRDVARARGDRRVLARVRADGAVVTLRRGHLRGAWIEPASDDGAIALHVPAVEAVEGIGGARFLGGLEAMPSPVVLEGAAARNTLARALVRVNAAGAGAGLVDEAVEMIARAPSPADYLAALAANRVTLGLPGEDDVLSTSVGPSGVDLYWLRRAEGEGIPPERREAWRQATTRRVVCGARWGGPLLGITLEMALHEESERRALHGELALLRAAWREAEEIAALADRLAMETSEEFGETQD